MKIIILGAGQFGTSLAASLASEANDINVVDVDAAKLFTLQERYDLRTVRGNASHPSVLDRAGASAADMLIAVTNSDETNMLACQIGYTLFHISTKIARVRSSEYFSYKNLFAQEALPVDLLISPESLVAEYVEQIIAFPEAQQIVGFAGGRAQMISLRCTTAHGPVGRKLGSWLPDVDYRCMAIFRNKESIVPDGDTVIQAGDEMFLLGDPRAMEQIRAEFSETQKNDRGIRRIILAGGGNIGKRLASHLGDDYHVKLIEINPEQARQASEELNNVIVLQGSATDRELLINENIDQTDLFCAITESEETNLVTAMLAKELGATRTIALVNSPAFAEMANHLRIDKLIIPTQISISAMLSYLHRGDVAVAHFLRDGKAEALETVIHGDHDSSRVVGRTLAEIELPKHTSIGAIVRDHKVLIAHHDLQIQTGDHVIVLVSDKHEIPAVESLFRVAATYI